MEEIFVQIEQLNRLCILCLAGTLTFGITTVFVFQKLKIKEIWGFFRRHGRKLLLLFFCTGIFGIGNRVVAETPGYADTVIEEDTVEGDEKQEEETKDEMAPEFEIKVYGESEEELSLNEEETQLNPYINAAQEVYFKIELQEEFLDEEESYVKLTRKDRAGRLLEKETILSFAPAEETGITDTEQESEEVLELKHYICEVQAALDGHYTAEFYAIDLAGNVSKRCITFALDYTAPEIEEIYCTNEEGEMVSYFANQQTYQYFSKEPVYVHVCAKDLVSGIGTITYFYELEDDYFMQTEDVTELQEDAVFGEIVLELPYSFKGTFSAWADDQLGQVMQSPKTVGIIAESGESHKENSYALSEVLTAYSKTPGYYATDVEIQFTVMDAYSGIRWINYQAGVLEERTDYTEETELVTGEVVKNYIMSVECHQENNIPVGLKFLDYAGHEEALKEEELPVIHIDTIKPQVEVVYDNMECQNEKYYREKRTAEILVAERNFDPEDVHFKLEGPEAEITPWSHIAGEGCTGDTNPKHTGHMDTCVWKCQVNFKEDGEYSFGFSCTDLAGNTGSYGKIDEFVIDQTQPKVMVSYHNHHVQNEIYYQDIRIATIEIEEKNFDASCTELDIGAMNRGVEIKAPAVSSWTTVEDHHYAVIAYDYDGEFTFDIHCTDLAGNESAEYETDHFIIDLTKPEILFDGIMDQSANNEEAAPLIQISDTNYDGSQTELLLLGWNRGETQIQSARADSHGGEVIKLADFPREKEQDDLYRLQVRAIDFAGNVSEEQLMFSVNRFGSVFEFDLQTENLLNTYYTAEAIPLVVTETNVDLVPHHEIICNFNGKLITLQEGEDYTIFMSGDETSWKQYRYEIKEQNFSKDGHYAITIYSKDRAANQSNNLQQEKRLEFAVDRKAPQIVMSGVDDQMRYREHSRKVEIYVEDNVTLSEVVVIQNGKQMSVSAEEMEQNRGNITLAIENDVSWQTLQIKAKDMAGNEAVSEEYTFLITPNLWVQFWQMISSFLHKILSFSSF